MRWLIVFLLAFLRLQRPAGWLRTIGLGRLPGDFSFRLAGREWYVPLASSLLLSLLAMLIGSCCCSRGRQLVDRPLVAALAAAHAARTSSASACTDRSARRSRSPGNRPGWPRPRRASAGTGSGAAPTARWRRTPGSRPRRSAGRPAADLEATSKAASSPIMQRKVSTRCAWLAELALVPLAKAVLADAFGQFQTRPVVSVAHPRLAGRVRRSPGSRAPPVPHRSRPTHWPARARAAHTPRPPAPAAARRC